MIYKVLKVFKNKLLLKVMLTIITYMTFCGFEVLRSYDLFSWLMIIVFYLLYSKIDLKKYSKETKKDVLIISVVFSILTLIGYYSHNIFYKSMVSLWQQVFLFKSFYSLVGLFCFYYALLINIIPKICEINKIKIIRKKIGANSKMVFWIFLVLIFLCYTPYFFAYYPGVLSYDSIKQMEIIEEGFKTISDHHPFIHTLFMAIPYLFGKTIFGNANAGVATISIVQMLIMSAIFSYFLTFLYKRGVRKSILTIIFLYFAFIPMHANMSVTMWKDVLFAGSLLLLTIETLKMVEKKEITLKNSLSFILVSLFNIFFRNNAIYAYIILTIFSFIILKKHYKQLALIFLVVYGIYFGIKGPVYKFIGVMPTESAEYISMPLQQIGRMAQKDVDFTKEEKKLINKLIPLDTLKEVYNPVVVDNIKLNEKYNSKAFDNNKLLYLKLWSSLVIKHPAIAIESYLLSTLGYYYPDVEYWSVASDIFVNNYNIYRDSKSNLLREIIYYYKDKSNLIINLAWSIGLSFWIIFIFVFITKKLVGKKYLYCFVPVFGIWLTMMVASPVFAEFRYVYGAFTTLPLLVMLPFIVKRSD